MVPAGGIAVPCVPFGGILRDFSPGEGGSAGWEGSSRSVSSSSSWQGLRGGEETHVGICIYRYMYMSVYIFTQVFAGMGYGVM